VVLDITSDYGHTVGDVDVARADIARVIINVVNNACYATRKRQEERGDGYRPALRVTTRAVGESVEVRMRDNGTGMSSAVLARLFTPFFTTKPPGEGTGLGLSLSHDIVVQGHQGQLFAESVQGEYTEFVMVLPRRARDGGGAGP
jgi:signal transduction histidine kinase